jgi:hypothetical protein
MNSLREVKKAIRWLVNAIRFKNRADGEQASRSNESILRWK